MYIFKSALSTHLTERDGLIETLREREHQTLSDLRERDALIESLGEERDQRDQEIVQNRREFQNLLAEKDRDIDKLLVGYNYSLFSIYFHIIYI
jgi:hypothetical protein